MNKLPKYAEHFTKLELMKAWVEAPNKGLKDYVNEQKILGENEFIY